MDAIVGSLVISTLTAVSTGMHVYLSWMYQGWQDLKTVGQGCSATTSNWRTWVTGNGRRRYTHFGCNLQYTADGKMVSIDPFECSKQLYDHYHPQALQTTFLALPVTFDPDNLTRVQGTDDVTNFTNGYFSFLFSDSRRLFMLVWASLVWLIAIPVIIFILSSSIVAISIVLVVWIVGSIGCVWYFYYNQTIKAFGVQTAAQIRDAPPPGSAQPMPMQQQQPMGMVMPMQQQPYPAAVQGQPMAQQAPMMYGVQPVAQGAMQPAMVPAGGAGVAVAPQYGYAAQAQAPPVAAAATTVYGTGTVPTDAPPSYA